MIKKLQAKCIFINMLIVTIMLTVIFSVVYISTKNNLERESIQVMSSIVSVPKMPPVPGEQPESLKLPYFCIIVDQNNQIIDTYGELFDLSDTEFLTDIVNKVSLSSSDTGTLSDYNLRYLLNETPMGKSYIFMNLNTEQLVLNALLKNCVIIGSLAYIIFFGISILFAKWAVRPVKEALKQQKQFIADASHELKTPLTVIMSNAQLLHETGCTEQERLQLSSGIISMSNQMRGLVESMLDLARIDCKSNTETMTRISLSDTVQTSAMTFEPVFFENNMSFDYEIEPNLELLGNSTQLKQVVDILLDNAVKYSHPEGHSKLLLTHTSAGKFLICVSNRGEPIPKDELDNIFKRFYRIEKARTSSRSYGLGLAIAESIVHEHHGKIWAESKDGWNSFYVELPV